MPYLHITNGSAITPLIREAGVPGRIVPWDDVLHEWPVPAGLNTAALRDVRAQFIAGEEGSYDEVARGLAARDAALDDLHGVDEIVLWFEHDLYDQLQLIQVLERLSLDRGPRVSAVPGDDYLGSQPPARFATLFPARREITSAEQSAARDAWQAFRSTDPRAILDVLPRVAVLPHLGPALRRHLQQFPSIKNGLSRTEQQTLEALDRGVSLVRDLYMAANHEREEAVFMGDRAFLWHVRGLMPRLIAPAEAGARVGARVLPDEAGVRALLDEAGARVGARAPDEAGARALLDEAGARARLDEADVRASLDSQVAITGDGRRVLNGEADRVELCGIDRWLGGVHLVGYGPVWRWDPGRQTVRLA